MPSLKDDLDFENAFTERTPRIVTAAKLLKSQGRRKADAFLAEGFNSVEAAVVTGAASDVFATQKAAARYPEVIAAARNMGVYVHPISDRAAQHLSDTVTPAGLFALCSPVLWSAKEVLGKAPQIVAVPVQTSDPGNAGTLIRVSDAIGADCVLFAGETTDPQGPKAVRSSAGSLFHIPVARDTNFQAVIDRLKAKNLTILATTADGEHSLDDGHFEKTVLRQPVAWLFGNEAHGLPQELIDRADYTVRIPIHGRAESLNLATAASICLYESAKQRHTSS